MDFWVTSTDLRHSSLDRKGASGQIRPDQTSKLRMWSPGDAADPVGPEAAPSPCFHLVLGIIYPQNRSSSCLKCGPFQWNGHKETLPLSILVELSPVGCISCAAVNC